MLGITLANTFLEGDKNSISVSQAAIACSLGGEPASLRKCMKNMIGREITNSSPARDSGKSMAGGELRGNISQYDAAIVCAAGEPMKTLACARELVYTDATSSGNTIYPSIAFKACMAGISAREARKCLKDVIGRTFGNSLYLDDHSAAIVCAHGKQSEALKCLEAGSTIFEKEKSPALQSFFSISTFAPACGNSKSVTTIESCIRTLATHKAGKDDIFDIVAVGFACAGGDPAMNGTARMPGDKLGDKLNGSTAAH